MIRKKEHPKKGDIVYIDPNGCYENYSQFIKWHWKYAIKWAYKAKPNKDHMFKVLGVHGHVLDDKFDRNDKVIVVEDIDTHQIFLIGDLHIYATKEELSYTLEKMNSWLQRHVHRDKYEGDK